MPAPRIHRPVDPPRPIWLRVWKTSWEPNAEWPALLHEWVGLGPEGQRWWEARVEMLPVDDPPPAWDPARPWVPADRIRPRVE